MADPTQQARIVATSVDLRNPDWRADLQADVEGVLRGVELVELPAGHPAAAPEDAPGDRDHTPTLAASSQRMDLSDAPGLWWSPTAGVIRGIGNGGHNDAIPLTPAAGRQAAVAEALATPFSAAHLRRAIDRARVTTPGDDRGRELAEQWRRDADRLDSAAAATDEPDTASRITVQARERRRLADELVRALAAPAETEARDGWRHSPHRDALHDLISEASDTVAGGPVAPATADAIALAVLTRYGAAAETEAGDGDRLARRAVRMAARMRDGDAIYPRDREELAEDLDEIAARLAATPPAPEGEAGPDNQPRHEPVRSCPCGSGGEPCPGPEDRPLCMRGDDSTGPLTVANPCGTCGHARAVHHKLRCEHPRCDYCNGWTPQGAQR